MSTGAIDARVAQAANGDVLALAGINRELAAQTAEQRVAFALAQLPGVHVLSSSFGAQAAVSLHLLTRQRPELPVILIDTGYLFAETLAFAEQLRERLGLNLQVFRAEQSPAQMEARHGLLWQQGRAGIEQYNRLRKVEPMRRALTELGVGTWFAGIRRQQSDSRRQIEFLERRDGRFKLHPLADWSNRDIGRYLQTHQLPYHPLWQQGYLSIGDRHSTTRWSAGMREEETRSPAWSANAACMPECGSWERRAPARHPGRTEHLGAPSTWERRAPARHPGNAEHQLGILGTPSTSSAIRSKAAELVLGAPSYGAPS